MGKIRVFELAKELNTTSKELLDKMQELNIAAKSHMSVLEDDAVALVKEVVLGRKAQVVVEKRIRDTVIRRRKRLVGKPSEAEVEPLQVEVQGEEAPAAAIPTKPESETVESEPAVALEPAEEEGVKSAPQAVVATEQVIERPVAEAEKVEAKVEEKKPSVRVKVSGRRKGAKEAPAKIIKLPEVRVDESVPPSEAVPEIVPDIPAQAAEIAVKGLPADKALEEVSEDAKGKKKKREKEKVREEVFEDGDKRFLKKKIVFRKKEVLEKSDLYDDSLSRGRKGKKVRKGKVAVRGDKTVITMPKAIKRRIKIDDAIMVADLAKRMGVKAGDAIRKLMDLGVMASLNHAIDFETAAVVANEFNYEVERAAFEEDDLLRREDDGPDQLTPRPPVVTIMGHVDHGKTSLLDAIRETRVIDGEAGGITQHIGAYYVTVNDRQIVFLDTPGHEAFTAMRARGAEVTDLVVLVVAADDGVMPQTVEAINHARAAGVPIVATVNKIDKPEANPDRVKRELAEQGLVPEEWSGDTVFVNVSAKERTGIPELLEMILLQADVLELKANKNKPARGRVVEARLDVGRGAVATVLVQEGTLRLGDAFVSGVHHGKVRAMVDDRGQRMDLAGPSMPVEIQGLAGVPMAGDEFVVVEDEKAAKQISLHRAQKQRVKELAKTSTLTLEKYYERMKHGLVKDLNLIIKADVQGSIEALTESLQKIPSSEVKVSVIHSGTGAISESDVMLATVSNAIVVGFNVRPNSKVRELAGEHNVDIRFYDVIYNMVNDIKLAMVGLMEPTYEEHFVGRAEVRDTFHVAKVGVVAGCYVTEGKIARGQSARLIRDGVVVFDGKIGSLRRFKEDAREVQSGYECGIGMENFNDVKVNDVIECYKVEEVEPVLA